MADMTIDPKDITSVLERYVADFKPAVQREQVGRVQEVGDGIARIAGLPGAMANEMLEFTGGIMGLAMNLEEHVIGAVVSR